MVVIKNVNDIEFKKYGKVLNNYDVKELLNKMEETIIPEINDIDSNNIDAPNSIDDSINDSIDNQNINESNTNSFDVFANVNALLNQF